jgi:hypothetical protein
MGKMALFLVMALSLAVGIVTVTVNRSKNQLVENVTGFQKYTTARNIAHSGVNMLLSRMDSHDPSILDSLVPGKRAWMITNFMSGRCSVSIQLANPSALDTVDIICNSFFMDTSKYMKLRLRRKPVPFPVVGEAIGLRVPNVKFKISGTGGGKGFIDGRNHDEFGVLTPQPDTSNLPGVGVLYPADTTEVLTYKDNIDGTKDVCIDSSLFDPALFVDEYINAANITYNDGATISNATWGTKTDPWIIYCKGDVHISGTVTGWGILVVNGNLRVSGSIDFHGLAIAYKETIIDVLETGGGGKISNIIGGMLVAGPAGSSFEMRGSQNTVYSKKALEIVRYISKLQWYNILYWYE